MANLPQPHVKDSHSHRQTALFCFVSHRSKELVSWDAALRSPGRDQPLPLSRKFLPRQVLPSVLTSLLQSWAPTAGPRLSPCQPWSPSRQRLSLPKEDIQDIHAFPIPHPPLSCLSVQHLFSLPTASACPGGFVNSLSTKRMTKASLLTFTSAP